MNDIPGTKVKRDKKGVMPVRERQSRRGPVLLFLFNLTISLYAYL